MRKTVWGRLSAVVMAGSMAVLTGCSTGSGTSTGPKGSVTPDQGSALVTAPKEKCDLVARVPVQSGTALLEIVVDFTASRASLTVPAGVSAAIVKAQQAGMAVQVIGVNGAGAAPLVTPPVALDPQPGNDSAVAEEGRVLAKACVMQRLWDPAGIAPTAPGSDPVAAVSAALAQHAVEVVVISDGAPSGGSLGEAVWGIADDADAVRALAVEYRVPAAEKAAITWYHLGQTKQPLPGWATGQLQQFYGMLLGDQLRFDTATGNTGRDLPADGALPDPVALPERLPGKLPESSCVAVPAATLFEPDAARLVDPGALNDLAAAVRNVLNGHPTWPVHIGGHTADFGTVAGRTRLAQERAEVVAEALHAAGVRNTLVTHAYGADYPAVAEYRADGSHDLTAAARNRRVTVTVGSIPASGPEC